MEPQRAHEKWGEDKKKREGGGETSLCLLLPSPLSHFFVLAPLFARFLISRRSLRGKEETTRSLFMYQIEYLVDMASYTATAYKLYHKNM